MLPVTEAIKLNRQSLAYINEIIIVVFYTIIILSISVTHLLCYKVYVQWFESFIRTSQYRHVCENRFENIFVQKGNDVYF